MQNRQPNVKNNQFSFEEADSVNQYFSDFKNNKKTKKNGKHLDLSSEKSKQLYGLSFDQHEQQIQDLNNGENSSIFDSTLQQYSSKSSSRNKKNGKSQGVIDLTFPPKRQQNKYNIYSLTNSSNKVVKQSEQIPYQLENGDDQDELSANLNFLLNQSAFSQGHPPQITPEIYEKAKEAQKDSKDIYESSEEEEKVKNIGQNQNGNKSIFNVNRWEMQQQEEISQSKKRGRPKGITNEMRREMELKRGRHRGRGKGPKFTGDYDQQSSDSNNDTVDPSIVQKIQNLINLHRSIPSFKIAAQLQIKLKTVIQYLSHKQFTTLDRVLEDIVRENPRQRLIQLQKKLLVRHKRITPCRMIGNVLKKQLHYYFTCGKPRRIQQIYEKRDSPQILRMRFKFCDYLRNNKYKIKDIYFVGVRVYSFQIKGNYIWLPEDFRGVLEKDYSPVKFKDNQAIILITISYQGIVKYDILTNRLTESKLIEHIQQGYHKKIKQNSNQNSILILTNTIPEQLYPKWEIESQLKAGSETSFEKKISPSDISKRRAQSIKKLAGKLSLKKYMNQPPFSHKLNPLQGLFLKIDSSIDIPELQKLFLKDIMNVELLQHQLEANLKEIGKKECQHYFNPLEIYLTIPQLGEHMFLQKHWEDIFFDTFTDPKVNGE